MWSSLQILVSNQLKAQKVNFWIWAQSPTQMRREISYIVNPLKKTALYYSTCCNRPFILFSYLWIQDKIMENRGNLCVWTYICGHSYNSGLVGDGLDETCRVLFIAHLSPAQFTHKMLFTFSQFWLWLTRDISHN